jgi:hypothetical protein
MATVLKALLQQRHIQTPSVFGREYDRIAREIEPPLIGQGPKKAQFYRWLAGDMTSLPQPHHCRILLAMFPEWTVRELFAQHSGVAEDLVRHPKPVGAVAAAAPMGGVEAVYATRLHFLRAMPPEVLFAEAERIDMAGLSLNMLCQQSDIMSLISRGAVIRCLFLDPAGHWISEREREEEHPAGLLSQLTDTNIRTLERIQAKAAGALEIRTYDQPIRFNITLVDQVCVMQPYMPAARGVESPTFVARDIGESGIFASFRDVFESMWSSSTERRIDG